MTAAPPDVRQLLADAATRLPGVDGRHEAELLLLQVLERERSWLFAHATDPVEPAQVAAFEALLRDAGFQSVATEHDLEQRDRVSLGCLPA